MKRLLGAICIGIACVGGCAAPQPPSAATGGTRLLTDRPATPGAAGTAGAQAGQDRTIAASAAPAVSDIIAKVGTQTITKDEMLAPMIEAHGLTFIVHLAQLEIVKQVAAHQGITVTPEDVKQERVLTFERMLKDGNDKLRDQLEEAKERGDNTAIEQLQAQLNVDPESLLDQFLAQQYVQSRQYVSRTEFNLGLETSAYLRKIAKASLDLPKMVTEEMLRKEFAVQYGEKVVVRHIQANDMRGIQEARRRLQAGEDFGEVARAVSVNTNTRDVGGAVRPFTMNDPDVPQILKDAAFELTEPGAVSETVHSENAFHILKLEKRVAPKVVTFEDVEGVLRERFSDQALQAGMKELRNKLASQALANLRIEYPALKQQFDRRLDERKLQKQQMDEQMKRDRAPATPDEEDAQEDPATQPAPGGETPASNTGSTQPANAAAATPEPAPKAAPAPTTARPDKAAKPGAAAKRPAPAPKTAPAPAAPSPAPVVPPANDDNK